MRGASYYALKRWALRPYVTVMRGVATRMGWDTRVLEALYYRPAIFLFIARFLRDEQVLHEAPIDSTCVVFDVGAFDGSWAEAVDARYGARTYAFEPDPRSFTNLQRRFARNPRVTCFDYALSDHDGAGGLERRGPGSTLYDDDPAPLGPGMGSVEVRVRDVVDVIDELEVDQIHLLKLNVEGAEYELLERLIATGYIERCGCILVQFHEWRAGAHRRRRRIRRALRSTHRLEWSYTFVWEKWVRR